MIQTNFSYPAATEVVILNTSGAASNENSAMMLRPSGATSDKNVVKIIFLFRCIYSFQEMQYTNMQSRFIIVGNPHFC